MFKRNPYFAVIGFTLIFGLSFVFSRVALDRLDPFHLLALRFLFAVGLINLLRLLKVVKVERSGPIKPLLAIGLVQPILYFTLETLGIRYTSAAISGLMVAVIPIFTLIFARIFLSEQPNRYQLAAMLVSIIGVALIGLNQRDAGNVSLLGLAVLLGAAVSAAAATVMSRWLSRNYSPVTITYAMMHMGLTAFLPMALIGLAEARAASLLGAFFQPLLELPTLTAIAYLGFGASVSGFFLLNYALAHLPSYKVGVFDTLTTLIAISAGVIFLGERLTPMQVIGGLGILIGVWGAQYFGTMRVRP